MNSLTRLREELVEILKASGLRGLAQMQGRFTPPVFFVIPGSPYLVPGNTFGKFTYTFRIVLVSSARAAEFSTKQLDGLIATAVVALHGSKFNLQQVSEPAGLTLGQGEYLGALVDVTVVDHVDGGEDE